MSYFAGYFQKKALHFALSQLGLFDQEAFDIDSQDITWGTTTTIELRNVLLSTSRLNELLQLPPFVLLTESRVSFLRLTLPLNFVSNSVVIEIEGLKTKLLVSLNDETSFGRRRKDIKPGLARGVKANFPRTQSSSEKNPVILTAPDDLAGSFLASCSPREKSEIRSAIAGSDRRKQKLDPDETDNVGIGPDVSLRTFFSNLTKGVLDRFKALIKDIQFEVTFKLQSTPGSGVDSDQNAEQVIFCLDVQSINIPLVSKSVQTEDEAQIHGDIGSRARTISITGIHGSLLSTSALSSFMSQLSGPASPALSRITSKVSDNTNHPESSFDKSRYKNPFTSKPGSFGSFSTQSETFHASLQTSTISLPNEAGRLGDRSINASSRRSITHDDEEHFPADFGEDSQALGDSEISHHHHHHHHHHKGSKTSSRLGSDLENSALSESSESFLCKSPTQRHGFGPSDVSHRSESESSGKESGTHSIESQPSHSDKLSELTESKGFSPERARSIYMSAVSLDDGRSGALSDHQTESMSEKDSIESLNEVFVDAPSGTQVQSTTQTPGSGIDLCGSSQASPSKMFKGFVSHESSDDDSPPASLLVSNYKGHAVIDPLLTEDVTISASAPQTSDIPKKQSSLKQLEANEILALPTNSSTTVRSLFMVTTIQIQLPPSTAEVVVSEMYTEEPVGSSNLPGAFSDSSSLDISSSSDMDDIKESPPSSSSKEIFPNDVKFAVNISEIVFHFDMPLARLLVIVANQFPPAPSDAMTEETTKALDNKLCYSIRLQRCIVRFEEALRTRQRHFPTASSSFIQEAFSTTADDLLRFVVEGIELTTKGNKDEFLTQLLVTKLHLGFPNEKILSFDRDIKVRESVRDTLMPSGHDVSIRMVQIYSSVTQLDMNTAPLHINVDINRLAEVVNWLGGLSTVLDLGNSVKSNMTITESSVATKGKPRGAHFDATEGTLTERNTKPSPKINLRIGGLALDIRGREASVLIESSALKVVFRDGAVRLQVDRVHLFGPLLANQNVDPAVILSIDSLAITYFDLPKESDLTRLLALLSPSQDREEQDEDILLDTLLRQRRKGAVLRLGITKAKARVSQLHNLQYFGILGEELSQLSSVTKYLPEDDRPGLLILTALDNTQIEIDINQNIQAFSLSIKGTQSAMVTFPSLFLMSVSNINATHAAVELIGQATSDLRRSTTRQNLVTEETPRLSIRFIAGEMEPTVRLKLYDIRLEYHVTTIMAILGISETAGGEVLVAEMVNTVANLATVENTMGQSLLFRPGEAAPKSQKPFRVDVSIRDVAIGLNPKDKPAQALLLLTKCRIVASHTGEQASNGYGSLNISKAYFMVTDDKENLLKVEEITDPNIVSGLGTQPTQIQCLEAIGYVSIGETSSAKITGHLKNSSAGSLLDVEVGDDLLVFETCADSTQTLLSILGGLAPPGPPCTGEKYRTEVIPINDMLASFSGEAFATDETEEDDTDYAGSSDDETGTIALDELNDPALDFDSENEFGDGPMSMESDVTHFGISSVILRQPDEDDIRNDPHLASFQEVAGTTSSLHFNEDHFGKAGQDRGKEWNSHKNTYDAANPAKIDASPLQIRFKDIHFIWNLYDGYDWQKTRDVISQAADVIETKAEERRAARRDKLRNIEDEESEAVIGDMLFNSIYIGISAKDDPRDLNRKVNRILDDDSSETGSYATTTTISAAPSRQGLPSMKKKRLRLGRSKHHKMTFELKGISGNIVSFPPDSGETQSSINLTVRDFEIFDNVPTSTWKKFATYMHDAGDRQLGSSMIQMEMLVVKPDKDLLASETVLKISVLPLRLHVDQDALDFLTRFFEFRDDTLVKAPISTDIPFIQRAEVGPVRIKLDFKPKKVDWKALRSGRTAEFMNFIILDEADMVLRRIILYGVRGFDVLGRSLNDIWTPDVRKNQLPGVLAGLAPVRPLVNVGLGVRDLIVIPMREYKKDGRLVRAVRKGVVSFGRTTTTELAKLGAKLAVGTHTILSGAEGLLVPGGRSLSSRNEQPDRVRSEEQAGLSPYADQPIGVVQGLRGAYRGLERDLLLARDAIIAMPGEVMESDNTSGAAAAFLRSAPVVILRPAMGITKAVGQTLMGAANSLDKAERRRLEDKYKHR